MAMSVAMRQYAKSHNIDDLRTLCIVGFDNALHGTTAATLSVSSPSANPDNLPTHDWPRAEFP